MNIINDMPKLQSPFVRKLNEKGEYLVTPEVTPGYEWVFTDDDVIATEKLNGTNVSIIIENGQIIAVFNRTERIPFFNKGKRHIIEAIMESYGRGYMENLLDGQFFGECVGPKIQGNPYKLEKAMWIPFATYAQKNLLYKSWGKYAKTFEALNDWLKDGLMPLFALHVHGKDKLASMNLEPPEGIVFVQPKTGRMAKIRGDMYPWFKGARHKETEDAQ